MRKPDTALELRHIMLCGVSGCGKSYRIRQWIDAVPVVIAWDPDEDYQIARARTFRELGALWRAGERRVALTVDPTPTAFGYWAAWVRSSAQNEKLHAVVVAEEIAQVTAPGKAPPAWGWLQRQGRKYGLGVVSATQRAAESDKTAFTQARWIWIGQCGERDTAYLEREIGEPIPGRARPVIWDQVRAGWVSGNARISPDPLQRVSTRRGAASKAKKKQ